MWRDSRSVQAERRFCLPAANHAYAFPSPFVSNLFISVFARSIRESQEYYESKAWPMKI